MRHVCCTDMWLKLNWTTVVEQQCALHSGNMYISSFFNFLSLFGLFRVLFFRIVETASRAIVKRLCRLA